MARKPAGSMPKANAYKGELRELQIELVRVHRHIIHHGWRVLVLFEGRDAAGKDGTIKRVVEHLSPRDTRVVALGAPSDREQGQWYFQRFVSQLPSAGEFVLFNRSWYNRAGVEPVMGFCTHQQSERFLRAVVPFERMLVQAGIVLVKYYLDISRGEQRRRLKARARDPLTQWKTSAVDAAAQSLWSEYSRARDRMLQRTHSAAAPWVVVHTDDKREARLNLLRDLVRRIELPIKGPPLAAPDPKVVFAFRPERQRLLAP